MAVSNWYRVQGTVTFTSYDDNMLNRTISHRLDEKVRAASPYQALAEALRRKGVDVVTYPLGPEDEQVWEYDAGLKHEEIDVIEAEFGIDHYVREMTQAELMMMEGYAPLPGVLSEVTK